MPINILELDWNPMTKMTSRCSPRDILEDLRPYMLSRVSTLLYFTYSTQVRTCSAMQNSKFAVLAEGPGFKPSLRIYTCASFSNSSAVTESVRFPFHNSCLGNSKMAHHAGDKKNVTKIDPVLFTHNHIKPGAARSN